MFALVLRIRTPSAAVFAGLVACSRPLASLDDEAGESDSETTTSTESSTSEASTSDDESSTSASDELGFIPEEHLDLPIPCGLISQECPEGQKCIAYSSDGGNGWNDTKCVPVTGDQHAGELCHWGGITEGTDDCDANSICWDVMDVDGELLGTCAPFCSGTPDEPECPPMHACIINSGPLALCVQLCHPVEQDCGAGLGCYWAVTSFSCIFTTDNIPTGEPCEYINDCVPGDFCTDASALPDCAGLACCTNFCDLELGDTQCAALPGTACVTFFEEGMAPPGYENVGTCILPA